MRHHAGGGERRRVCFAGSETFPPEAGEDASHRAIVVGYGPVGQTVVRLLSEYDVDSTVELLEGLAPRLLELADDIRRLGFEPHEYRRLRGEGRREEIILYVVSIALHALLAGLGSPVGKKDWAEAPMPWLFQAAPWVRAWTRASRAAVVVCTEPAVPPDSVTTISVNGAPQGSSGLGRVLRTAAT